MGRTAVLTIALLAAALISAASAQKYGGVLRTVDFENPPSLSMHEETALSAIWPTAPIYGNLVAYNPSKPVESGDDVVGELAESWAWNAAKTQLTFKLRRGVTWHDGKPFTSADVKHTFDVVRGASELRFRLNPHKPWYANIKDIVTQGDYEITFILSRPQPSLIAIFAAATAPVVPAHVPLADLRTRAIGTGPFRLKEYLADQRVVLEKNPAFYVKGRPYLDGIEYIIIKSRPTRYAALQAGQIDAYIPLESSPQFRDSTLALRPNMVVHTVAESISDHINFNVKKPPFDNPKVRLAVNYALDRHAMIRAVLGGGGIPSGALLPPPFGPWGLPAEELAKLPGYGDPVKDKAQARQLLAEAGYGPDHPLKLAVSTRDVATFTEMAAWALGELRAVGIDATLETVETVAWYPRLARRDFSMTVNRISTAAADPDANFYENYTCGALRNYSDYCNPELETLMDRASQETDHAKRLQMVQEVDRRLQLDGAAPTLSHRLMYYMHYPYVKGLIPHNNSYNFGRFTDVWLDR